MKFYHIKDHDSLGSMKVEQLQIMVEDYVMDLKKRVNPNSVPTYINPIQTFLDVNDVELKWKKIHKLYPAKIKSTGRQAYTNNDIKNMLSVAITKRNKALVHFLAATGCRIGALKDLKIKNLVRIEDCYAVLIYEDSVEEYWTFLTPEATNILDDYLNERRNNKEYITESSPVFRRSYQFGVEKSRPMTQKALEENMARITKRAGLRAKSLKKGNRFDKMLDHAFRKRFETILKLNKDIPVAVAEKLVGHQAYIDDRGNKIQQDKSYVVPEIEQLFKYFKLAIPDLIIDDSERMKAQNQKLQERLSEKESLEASVEELKLKFDRHEIKRNEKQSKLEKRIKELEEKASNSDRKTS